LEDMDEKKVHEMMKKLDSLIVMPLESISKNERLINEERSTEGENNEKTN
jgi:hypothetical protein